MKRIKRIISVIMCMVLMFTVEVPSNAQATNTNSIRIKQGVMEGMESELIQKEASEESGKFGLPKVSKENRFWKKTVIEEEPEENLEDELSDNTDPNNAYLVENEDVVQGTLSVTGEIRWYGFVVNQTSTETILMQTVNTVDADLYLFELNQTTYQLSLIGGSATEGVGISEICKDVLDSGIYYIAVRSRSGAGQFAFAFYLTEDTANEVNDTVNLATAVSSSAVVIGEIDSPYDYDYYTFEVTSPVIIEFTKNIEDYDFDFISIDSNAHIYSISNNNPYYKLTAGSYCFRVYSSEGDYDQQSNYTITLNKIADISSNASATCYMVNKMANVVFQSDAEGKNMYVNGHPININYSYYLNSSNSAGTQIYDISMTTPSDLKANIYTDDFMFDDPDDAAYYGMTVPDVVYYLSGNRGVGPNNIRALELSVYSPSTNFYHIHCNCSGAYIANKYNGDFNFVTVLINPDTGNLVDIEHINYYYEFIGGSNSMTFTRPYSAYTKYLYPYYNGNEPETW